MLQGKYFTPVNDTFVDCLHLNHLLAFKVLNSLRIIFLLKLIMDLTVDILGIALNVFLLLTSFLLYLASSKTLSKAT